MSIHDIEAFENIVRQINFWLKEARDSVYNQPAYSRQCLGQARRAAKAISSLAYGEEFEVVER